MSRNDRAAARHREVIRRLDALIDGMPPKPIYSKALADLIGVSIRTLQNATHESRGMRLHEYVRWKRLMSAREKLQHGAASVKDAALQSGFWHFGEFARQYQKLFGELPSSTLQSMRG